MEKIFEVATRNKFRFQYKGLISVEDLWDLKVESLDEIYKHLIQEQKKANEESLLSVKSNTQKVIDLKIEIVKYIVGVKLEELNARAEEKANKEKKQMILGILAEKENQDLKSKSIDELKSMIDSL